jgi:hypothetical protein
VARVMMSGKVALQNLREHPVELTVRVIGFAPVTTRRLEPPLDSEQQHGEQVALHVHAALP